MRLAVAQLLVVAGAVATEAPPLSPAEKTVRELEAGGRRAKELDGLLRDVAARAGVSFTIRDTTG